MVAIGAGAALAGLVSAVPQLVWLSEHKAPLFAVAGTMIAAAGVFQWRARRALECPSDPALAADCNTTRDISLAVWWVSVAILAIGAFFAFLAPLIV
jgi:hypothetical protein